MLHPAIPQWTLHDGLVRDGVQIIVVFSVTELVPATSAASEARPSCARRSSSLFATSSFFFCFLFLFFFFLRARIFLRVCRLVHEGAQFRSSPSTLRLQRLHLYRQLSQNAHATRHCSSTEHLKGKLIFFEERKILKTIFFSSAARRISPSAVAAWKCNGEPSSSNSFRFAVCGLQKVSLESPVWSPQCGPSLLIVSLDSRVVFLIFPVSEQHPQVLTLLRCLGLIWLRRLDWPTRTVIEIPSGFSRWHILILLSRWQMFFSVHRSVWFGVLACVKAPNVWLTRF